MYDVLAVSVYRNVKLEHRLHRGYSNKAPKDALLSESELSSGEVEPCPF